MSRMRTNPEYTAMAYRRALLLTCCEHLTKFTDAMGQKPQGKILSDDVIREDSEVPLSEVQEYILGLQQEAESLRLEMLKFDFVKRGSSPNELQPKAEESNGNRATAKGKRQRASIGQ